MNTVIKFIKWLREGVVSSLFFVCAVRGQIARWFVRRAKTILLIILATLKLFCQQKMGKQKLQWAIFSVRCSRRFFSRPLCGPKNAVNFLDLEGSKKGCNPWPSAERFTFVRCEAMSKVQKRYSLTKSNRNAPRNPDFGL